MTYDLTITFEHGELSLKGCSKPFSTEDLAGEDPFGLNLGKPKEVTIIFKSTNNYGKETNKETGDGSRPSLSPF